MKEGDIVHVARPYTDDIVKAVIIAVRMNGYSIREVDTGDTYFVEDVKVGRYKIED